MTLDQPHDNNADPSPADHRAITPTNENDIMPPESTLKLWQDVGQGIDKNLTVVWKSAVDSLVEGRKYFGICHDARAFVEQYMSKILQILLEQIPQKIGQMEQNCVQESLYQGLLICLEDLKVKSAASEDDSQLVSVLALIFNKRLPFYKGSKHSWNNTWSGLPEIRIQLIDKFKVLRGFGHLTDYLEARIGTSGFPSAPDIKLLLDAGRDAVPGKKFEGKDEAKRILEDDIIGFAKAVMNNMELLTDEDLKKINIHEDLSNIRWGLQSIFQGLILSRRNEVYEFYAFCRNFSLKLITSQSLPLKLYGWETVNELVEISQEMAPPPRAFIVSGAGTDFVNGTYVYNTKVGEDGFAHPKADHSYEYIFTTDPTEPNVNAGRRKLTLFKCTMRSQQKWWFISEADEQQPGTDKDIDYYQQKSKKKEENFPPRTGWSTCRNAGLDPPPYLEPKGLVVPPGEEYNTVEHQMAKWAIENKVVELVLGSSIHREIVARSIRLIGFLVQMCTKDEPVNSAQFPDLVPNQYCLNSEHLNLAWKTCESKLDAAVSAQVYELLVSILPSLPDELAVNLLNTIRKSCNSNILEVAEFCFSLAKCSEVESLNLSEEVRDVLLKLLWSILTHPDVLILKCYEAIRSFMAQELTVEPRGSLLREEFIDQCKRTIIRNCNSASCDETEALRIIRLTRFVLEACPREQATIIIAHSKHEIANLMFDELNAYLRRKSSSDTPLLIKKTSSNLTVPEEFHHGIALETRLDNLRFVFGLSDTVQITLAQLNMLWELCTEPDDREALMVFLAKSSFDENPPSTMGPSQRDSIVRGSHQALTAAFSNEVGAYAFQKLFCSEEMHWEYLGPKAYESFQELFKHLSKPLRSTLTPSGPALDALWRICLYAGDDNVASQAMNDLLRVYCAFGESKRLSESNSTNAWTKRKTQQDIVLDPEETFSFKIFDCLAQVKKGLQSSIALSVRSAERCVRILNAAVGHNPNSQANVSILVKAHSIDSIHEILEYVPHGFRGQGCYKTIIAVARRTGSHQSSTSRNLPQSERISIQMHPLETLHSLKTKVANACNHPPHLVRAISMNNNTKNLNIEPENAIVGDLGINQGSEIVFLLASNPFPESQQTHALRQVERKSGLGPSEIFGGNGQGPTDEFFNALLEVLEALSQASFHATDTTESLVWDLLQSVPSNAGLISRVRAAAQVSIENKDANHNSMSVDFERKDAEWSELLNPLHYATSVYVLQLIDSFIQPATEFIRNDKDQELYDQLVLDASLFRQGLIESGGFDAVLRFYLRVKSYSGEKSVLGMENCCVLRILKACLYGRSITSSIGFDMSVTPTIIDNLGQTVIKSIDNVPLLLENLTRAIVMDKQISANAITDSLLIIQCLLVSDPAKTQIFATLPNRLTENFIVNLLLRESHNDCNGSCVESRQIRETTEGLVMRIPDLSQLAMPWLTRALENLSINKRSTDNFFSVLQQMVTNTKECDDNLSKGQLQVLSENVCKKLVSFCDKDSSNSVNTASGVLCGCLKLLKSIIEISETNYLESGVKILLSKYESLPWSLSHPRDLSPGTAILVDLMGVIFDKFLSDSVTSSLSSAICSDSMSRQIAFEVLNCCAKLCEYGEGYVSLCSHIGKLLSHATPTLRHKWGRENIGLDDAGTASTLGNVKYSGLKNQGCTCYMNSVLQQLFMMPELRKSLSDATLPVDLRTTSTSSKVKGSELVCKEIALQWESGIFYNAKVIAFNETTSTHTLRYLPVSVSDCNVNKFALEASISDLAEEFVLSEGRPGKETGVYKIISSMQDDERNVKGKFNRHEESDDEAAYRRLLEEVQRTFVHLDKGSRGRVFDPKTLVEASGCLKLEFDIWQQNDASEYAMKLLDKLEIPLKKWSPNAFKFLEHTFRLKQTKQKLCKECGLKTNREENLMNIDCQIRGKSDIHEALSTMCEVEYMEGDNKVFCDNCKKNCDTVLRTAISALPDMLILSLKRFDLDYNTFETVKLNSRCEFGQKLNMKRYTLEGLEAMENMEDSGRTLNGDDDPLNILPDEDYEYRLAGVLVHHGVAQGGHYYSFIRDRTQSSEKDDQWYRFDDDEVTPFNPSNIEVECFGGKIKKETKWPNGQVNTVETDQLANALMLFYEKVKPSNFSHGGSNDEEMQELSEENGNDIEMITGSEHFQDDVCRSNSMHRSHSFLFQNDFQDFMQRLLNLFLTEISTFQDADLTSSSLVSQYLAILNVCTSLFFDILLHNVDRKSLEEWCYTLCQAFRKSVKGSVIFVSELARRTHFVADNWLQTFSVDCPEPQSREAAMAVFASAIESALHSEKESFLLNSWTQEWEEELVAWENHVSNLRHPLPIRPKTQQNNNTSSVGEIVSCICSLLDFSPRFWRFSPQLCFLLINLGIIDNEKVRTCIRAALAAAQVPARLICTILRDKSHPVLRAAMPGASLSAEVVEQTTKVESSTHLLPLNTNSVGMNSGLNVLGPASGSPTPSDHSKAIEALAVLIGIRNMSPSCLTLEPSQTRGGPTTDLTQSTKYALGTIFEEFSTERGSMSQKDIIRYMQVCKGAAITQQKLSNILNKYGSGPNCLTFEGFLDYYRDVSQTSEVEFRADLHALGFRPDLSRCPEDLRIYNEASEKVYFDEIERVVNDVVALAKNDDIIPMGNLTKLGLNSLHLYHTALFSESSHLAKYLMAWTVNVINNKNTVIISEALQALYHTQGDWTSNEVVQVVQIALKIVAASPGESQLENINMIMLSRNKISGRNEIGEGLLQVAKELVYIHSSQHYSNEYSHQSVLLTTYIEVIKELRNIRAVDAWMTVKKDELMWLEQYLQPDTTISDRCESSRRDDALHHGSYDQQYSDSDLNGIHESDDEDDDSRFEDAYTGVSNGFVLVEGAGISQVNGTYACTGTWDNVDLFTKNDIWEGRNQTFSLFRCRLSDNTKRWYISIVPMNNNPGTSFDIDFYYQLATGNAREVPGMMNWVSARSEADPPPIVKFQSEVVHSDHDSAEECDQ